MQIELIKPNTVGLRKYFVAHSNALDGIFLGPYFSAQWSDAAELSERWQKAEFADHLSALEAAMRASEKYQLMNPKDLHRRITALLSKYPNTNPGQFRDCEMWYDGRRSPLAKDIPALMEGWQDAAETFTEYSKIGNACYCDAFWLHKLFMAIRPFVWANGMVGRLLLLHHQLMVGKEVSVFSVFDQDRYYQNRLSKVAANLEPHKMDEMLWGWKPYSLHPTGNPDKCSF